MRYFLVEYIHTNIRPISSQAIVRCKNLDMAQIAFSKFAKEQKLEIGYSEINKISRDEALDLIPEIRLING